MEMPVGGRILIARWGFENGAMVLYYITDRVLSCIMDSGIEDCPV